MLMMQIAREMNQRSAQQLQQPQQQQVMPQEKKNSRGWRTGSKNSVVRLRLIRLIHNVSDQSWLRPSTRITRSNTLVVRNKQCEAKGCSTCFSRTLWVRARLRISYDPRFLQLVSQNPTVLSFYDWSGWSSHWCAGRKPWAIVSNAWNSEWDVELIIFLTSWEKLSLRLNLFTLCWMHQPLLGSWEMFESVKEIFLLYMEFLQLHQNATSVHQIKLGLQDYYISKGPTWSWNCASQPVQKADLIFLFDS